VDKRRKKFLHRVWAVLRPYVFAILFIFFALYLAGLRFGVFSISSVQNEGLTSTITASTEALSFSLQEDRQSAWILPAGIFLVTTDPSKNGDCEAKTEFVGGIDLLIGYQCTSASNTRLEINGAAEVSVVITPAGKLRLTVKPHGRKPLDLRVVDAGDNTLFPPQQELGYETTLPAKIPNSDDVYQVRVPLIATSAQVGSHLHYVSTIDTSPDDFWQPTLLSGNVSIIAQNHPDTEKFDVHSEALDTGDVLGIGRDPNESELGDEYDPEDERTDLVWGMATIGQQVTTMSGTTELDQFMIHAVLHTTHRQLSVRRFGTAKGHTIEASQWSILSKWPNGQKAWFILVTAAFLLTTALTTTLTTFLTVSDFFRGKPLRKKKKKKKKKKKGGKNEY
jgi:hypothetical protein